MRLKKNILTIFLNDMFRRKINIEDAKLTFVSLLVPGGWVANGPDFEWDLKSRSPST